MSAASEKRVKRAIQCARAAATNYDLSDVYLRRFHRAMDALETREEGEAVYDACRREGWYELGAKALSLAKDGAAG